MRRLIILAVVVLVLAAAGFWFLRSGRMDLSATADPSAVEGRVAMMALDASAERHAPRGSSPVAQTPANLVAGARLYRVHCAVCHGSPAQPESPLTFYPRAPQFVHDAPDMPANQNFFIIKQGIRWTGMPAWTGALTDDQIWTIVAFLGRLEDLPPAAQQVWTAPAETTAPRR